MEVEELRIGNCVQRHELTPIETISVITELSIETDFTNLLGIEHFEPIPLTEEWLIKFGFISDGGDLFEKNDIALFLTLDGFYKLDGFNTEIKYVHQLQNLYFALTGEELELKNN